MPARPAEYALNRLLSHLSDLCIADYRNRSSAENEFGESSVAALPRPKTLPSRYLPKIVYSSVKLCSGQDVVIGRARPASKLALASSEIPLIG
jgi:hypothetical protein